MDRMIRHLREDILSGDYAAGDYLPSELDLSNRFQISNNSVRKGLDVLVDEGLIEKIPRVGNRVKAPEQEAHTIIRLGCLQRLNDQTELTYLLSEFHRKYPHIRVQTVQIPKNSNYEYIRDFLDNGMIDVFTVNHFLFEEFVEKHGLDALEVQEKNMELYPFLNESFQHGDSLYAQPFAYSPIILCYNREHFSELNLPEPDSSWSWDDLIAYSTRLAVKNERFGFYFHLTNRNRWFIFLIQSGAQFLPQADGTYRVRDSGMLDGIEKVWDMIYTPQLYPIMLSASHADAERMFRDGQVSVIMTSYFAMNELIDAPFQFDVAPLPYLHDFNQTMLVSVGLCMNSRSKVKAAAKQLIDFLVSSDVQKVIAQKTFTLPAHKHAVQIVGDTELKRPARFQMHKEIIRSFSSFKSTHLKLSQHDDVLRELKLYWSGLKSKERLATSLEELLNKK